MIQEEIENKIETADALAVKLLQRFNYSVASMRATAQSLSEGNIPNLLYHHWLFIFMMDLYISLQTTISELIFIAASICFDQLITKTMVKCMKV